MGDRRYNRRAQAGVRCDSVEEQIACLIDHATDSNILGRTWGGWEPWVWYINNTTINEIIYNYSFENTMIFIQQIVTNYRGL